MVDLNLRIALIKEDETIDRAAFDDRREIFRRGF